MASMTYGHLPSIVGIVGAGQMGCGKRMRQVSFRSVDGNADLQVVPKDLMQTAE